jgi:hypothetical protein
VTLTSGETVLYEHIAEENIICDSDEDEAELSDAENMEEEIEEEVEEGTADSHENPLSCFDAVFKPPNSLPGGYESNSVSENLPAVVFKISSEDNIKEMLKKILKEIELIKEEVQCVKERVGDNARTIVEKTDAIRKTLERKFDKYSLKKSLKPQEPYVAPFHPVILQTQTEVQSVETPCNVILQTQTEVQSVETSCNSSSFVELLNNSILDSPTLFRVIESPVFDHENIESTPSSSYKRSNSSKKKRQQNQCVRFIKGELGRMFGEEELATGRVVSSKRKYKSETIENCALSPGRLQTIMKEAKKRFKEDFEKLENINEIINSKCRQVKHSKKYLVLQ